MVVPSIYISFPNLHKQKGVSHDGIVLRFRGEWMEMINFLFCLEPPDVLGTFCWKIHGNGNENMLCIAMPTNGQKDIHVHTYASNMLIKMHFYKIWRRLIEFNSMPHPHPHHSKSNNFYPKFLTNNNSQYTKLH